MIGKEHLDDLIRGNGSVLSPDGEKIGGIGRFYLDEDTREPGWITVKTGLFGLRESFVPLEGAWIQGDDIVVQHGKEEVKDAPLIDPDGHPGPDDEGRLYEHYNLGAGMRTYTEAVDGRATDGYPEIDYESREPGEARGRDLPGPDTRWAEDQGDRRRLRLHLYTGKDRDGGDESLAEELRRENTDS